LVKTTVRVVPYSTTGCRDGFGDPRSGSRAEQMAGTVRERKERTEQMVARDRVGEDPSFAPVRRGGTEVESKDWYSPDELWRWLGLGRTKTFELLRSGEIPSYRIGRIRREDIEAWLEQNKYQTGDG
jgi:excisionase family DNA binding protein